MPTETRQRPPIRRYQLWTVLLLMWLGATGAGVLMGMNDWLAGVLLLSGVVFVGVAAILLTFPHKLPDL